MSLFIIVLISAAVIFVLTSVKIVQQAEVIIVERWGSYNRTMQHGLNILIPFMELPRGIHYKISRMLVGGGTINMLELKDRIDLRESVYDFPRQNVITKDNVTIGINALLYYQIIDPKSAVYEIANLPDAIEKLTQTTLRNIIGSMDLDETLISRDIINAKLRTSLDEATSKWGVKVNRVELQDIVPPKEIQAAMEKQMKAERDRRATILEAEGLKRSKVLEAEGFKEAEINKAEGEKRAAILTAEGEAEARIKVAQAEAEAIRLVIEALKDNGDPDKYLIAVRYIEALKEMVSGESNKIVYMPYEATGVLSSLDSIKQMFTNSK
ncbi:MAG: SPFH/Band 7/PHB domain protein [Candidatus Gastranaerophilales bacterium]|nr:SPFH/Band 7/PHB domain protein [Candidatus Gastranaerophilales bacterium]